MKERASWPMKAWEVRAILDGRKTQTRRVVKLTDSGRVKEPGSPRNWHLDDPEAVMACPYGVPGDRLWVREAWQAFFADEVPADRPRGPRHTMGIPAQPERESFVFYRADGDLSHPEDGSEALWRPSIHMPRWASRLTLEIVSVRVERVQEISEGDCWDEGIEEWLNDDKNLPRYSDGTPGKYLNIKQAFRALWDSINAKRAAWESNPFVRVIEFRRVGE